MVSRAIAAAGMGLALVAFAAGAQQPGPEFAPSNLSAEGVRAMAATCAMCHGTDGRVVPGSPVAGLAGKPRDEIVQAMGQFRSGAKPATVMHQLSKGYSDAEIAALADYFSRQPR